MGLNSAQMMRQYRERMKAAGLRPIQLWVPDIRSQKIIDAVRRDKIREGIGKLDEKLMIRLGSSLAFWLGL